MKNTHGRVFFFNKVAVKVNYSSMGVFHIFETVQMLLIRATHNMVESNTVYLEDCYCGIGNYRNIGAVKKQFRFAYVL